ncbi:hypothetical protein PENSTE_c008G02692 [Penicillium steckii]|uniref:Uncharacterized protein n=1 Tax=Penicillium steckii TaxID=303698 RepID=A0A1V6TDC1_9EURO|nr:hypothetical protein PENSTE_c008G02692 [Penicillium steckii]
MTETLSRRHRKVSQESTSPRPNAVRKAAQIRTKRMEKRKGKKLSSKAQRGSPNLQMSMTPFIQEAGARFYGQTHEDLLQLMAAGASEEYLRWAQVNATGLQVLLATEIDRLYGQLTMYEESLRAGQVQTEQEQEKNKTLRRELEKELRNSFIREHYIVDLESEYTRLEQMGVSLISRNVKLTSELQYMNQRVQELEKDIDSMVESHQIRDSIYYNVFCEEIQQWKRLRHMMLNTNPKKTFWDLVHTYSNFMEQTLRLAEEAKKIFNQRFAMAEYFASRQMIEMLESEKDGYPSYNKILNYQPLSLKAWWQNRNWRRHESESDSDDSQIDDNFGFKFFNTPSTSPQTNSNEFTSVNQFVNGRKRSNLSYLKHQMDDDDDDDDEDGYTYNLPNFSEPAFVHLGTMDYGTGNQSQVRSLNCAQTNSHIRQQVPEACEVFPEGFQQRESIPDESILSQGEASRGSTIPRKRSKKRVSQTGLDDIETGEPLIQLSMRNARRRPNFGPYTRSETMFKKSVIHENLNRDGRLNDERLHARRRTKGHFPDRIVKAARRRSSRATSQGSRGALVRSSLSLPNLERKSLQQMISVRGSTASQSALSRDPEMMFGDHTLLGLIWMYCKKRPRDLIRPLVGIAVLAAVVYFVRDYQLYQRFVAANTASDRMMQRMRIAQAQFQTHNAYHYDPEWKRWLDVDRVALQ